MTTRLGQLILKPSQSNGPPLISGEISTYAMRLKFNLMPQRDKQSENSPSHLIYATAKHGGTFHAGAVWEGNTNQGEKYYSMQFDIPELLGDKPLKVVAWQENSTTYIIQPSKPQTEQAAA